MGATASTAPTHRAEFGVLERRLLNDYQQLLPLEPRPFARMAEALGSSDGAVLAALERLQERGAISRVGPVFRPHAVGTSTLAAMAVPADRLESVAALVSGFPEVNHNYEREHHFNLWFVATAADPDQLHATLRSIEQRSGLPVMSLPMEEAYHLNLGFRLDWGERNGTQPPDHGVRRTRHTARPAPAGCGIRSAADQRLVAAIQGGLPLVSRPYAAAGEQAGLNEGQVIDRLRSWLDEGVLSRLGVVVHHRRLGYRANAMVVWDVPESEVDALGACLGGYDFVNLCYRRPRRPPRWHYNLFCMIHGRDREVVRQRVARVVAECGLEGIPHELLFSRRRFKQRGARYVGGGSAARPAITVAGAGVS